MSTTEGGIRRLSFEGPSACPPDPGLNPAAGSTETRPKILEAPSNFEIAALGEKYAVLRHNIVPEAIGYLAHFKKEQENRWTTTSMEKQTLHHIAGLENGKYNFRVSAVDKWKQEGESTVVLTTTIKSPVAPVEQPAQTAQTQTAAQTATTTQEHEVEVEDDDPQQSKITRWMSGNWKSIAATIAILAIGLIVALILWGAMPGGENGDSSQYQSETTSTESTLSEATPVDPNNLNRVDVSGHTGPLLAQYFVMPDGTKIPGFSTELPSKVKEPLAINSANTPLDITGTVRRNSTPVVNGANKTEVQLPPNAAIILQVPEGKNVNFQPDDENFSYEILGEGSLSNNEAHHGSAIRFTSKNPNATITIPYTLSRSKL